MKKEYLFAMAVNTPKTSNDRVLDILNRGLTTRMLNGDFKNFRIDNKDSVYIETDNGRSYQLHPNEVNNIILQELEDFTNEIKSYL